MGFIANNSIERKTPLRSNKPMACTGKKRVPGTARLERKSLNKVGPRTKKWRKAWRFLKAEFEKRERTGCEFGFIPHECFGPLDPCHAHKRREMKDDDIYKVAIGCRTVHNFLDYSCTHEEMRLFVNRAIELAGGLILPSGKGGSNGK